MRNFFPRLLFLLWTQVFSQATFTQTQIIIQPFSSFNFYSEASKANDPIRLVDSIAHAAGTAKYFAEIYSRTMRSIDSMVQNRKGSEQSFIKKFETGFAGYFLKACYDHRDVDLPANSDWNCYFKHADLDPWQYMALGANTHINTDMWQALACNFTEVEIRQNKKQFLSLQSAIEGVYLSFFQQVMDQNKFLRSVNRVTNGLAKTTAEKLLCKWRVRSVELAILFYSDPKKFNRKLATIQRKKQKIDEMILRQ